MVVVPAWKEVEVDRCLPLEEVEVEVEEGVEHLMVQLVEEVVVEGELHPVTEAEGEER